MELQYRVEKSDHIVFCKVFIKETLKKRIGVILIFSVIFAVSLDTKAQWWEFLVTFLASFLISLVIFYYFPLWVSIRRYNRARLVDSSITEDKTLTTTDNGIEIISDSKTINWNWDAINSVNSIDRFIYLKLADKRVYVLPKKYFSSDADALNFFGLVQNRIGQTQGIENRGYKNASPPYSLGWLGIIPLVGGIVGIALILNGVFKYKDRKLVYIGIAGLAFTILLYSSLFFMGFNSDFEKEGFAKIAQSELNGLMKRVEFYKMKNGVYPDSLSQVNKDENFTSIYDPIQMSKAKYNYQKMGNKYYLYSSGVDGIPGTKDDLYPVMNIADTSKFGLIHR